MSLQTDRHQPGDILVHLPHSDTIKPSYLLRVRIIVEAHENGYRWFTPFFDTKNGEELDRNSLHDSYGENDPFMKYDWLKIGTNLDYKEPNDEDVNQAAADMESSMGWHGPKVVF